MTGLYWMGCSDQKFVKVFGERNTGTRALIKMLAAQPEIRLQPCGEVAPSNRPQNFLLREQIEMTYRGKWRKVYRDALFDTEHMTACPTQAWKHSLPVWDRAFKKKQARVIFCVRNPYSWILSLSKRPYHQRGPRTRSVSQLVSQPWLTLARDNMAPLLRSPMDLWNYKLSAYREFAKVSDVPFQFLKFEEFVSAPEVEVRRALGTFEVPSNQIRAIPNSTKTEKTSLNDIAKYYETEEWRGNLTAELVSRINDLVDWELAEHFGYTRIDPADFTVNPKTITSRNWSRNHNSKSRSGSLSRNAHR